MLKPSAPTDPGPMPVALEIPSQLADRLRRLAALKTGQPTAMQAIAVEALTAGIESLVEAPGHPPRAPAPEPARASDPAEPRRLVRRDGQLTQGSRLAADRRGGDRGGRRRADRTPEPLRLVDRVMQFTDAGIPAREIAARLDAEGLRTAGGRTWTAAAIQQLVRLETDRRAAAAWTPSALTGRSSPE